MGLVDANGHDLVGSDEDNLENLGKEAKEGEKAKADAEAKQEGLQDVRLVPTGTLHMNLCAVMNNIFFMEMNVEQAEQAAKAQRAIMDSPMLAAMKEQLETMHRTRVVIVNNINERTTAADEAYWSTLNIDVKDRTGTEEPEAAAEESPGPDATH